MNEFLDDRNTPLWNVLSEEFEISIEESPSSEYSCFTQNNTAIIYVAPEVSIDSFTHELLHIYLKKKEFFLGSSIRLEINKSNFLSSLLSDELIEHIGNCLDHLKMYPIYLEMRFDTELFLLDFNERKCTAEELNVLKMNFKGKQVRDPKAIDYYIGKVVAILCDPNQEHKYDVEIKAFKKMDQVLFGIIENLINQTVKFDLDSDDILVDYRDISSEFYKNMIKWVHSKKLG